MFKWQYPAGTKTYKCEVWDRVTGYFPQWSLCDLLFHMPFCKVTLPKLPERWSLILIPLPLNLGSPKGFIITNRMQWKWQWTTAKIRSERAKPCLLLLERGVSTHPLLEPHGPNVGSPSPWRSHVSGSGNNPSWAPLSSPHSPGARHEWRPSRGDSSAQPFISPVIWVFPAEAPDTVEQQHAPSEFLMYR